MLLSDLVRTVREETTERFGRLVDHGAAGAVKLCEIIGVLDESVESAYAKGGHGIGNEGCVRHGGAEGGECVGFIARVEAAER